MAFLPLFFDIEHRRILIIGGGTTALAKARRLCGWNCTLEVVALRLHPGFDSLEGVRCSIRAWSLQDLEDAFLVIAATGDPAQDEAIAAECAARHILCNAVDQPAVSSAVFGAVIHEQCLSIGISTSGASPSAAQWLRRQIRAQIPDGFDEILQWLGSLRPFVLRAYQSERIRARIFHALFDACMKKQDILTQQELEELLNTLDDES